MPKRRRVELAARLAHARSDTALVTVRRKVKGADRLDGYVLAVGSRWVLMAPLDNTIRLDGYTAIRIRDITSIKGRANSKFVRHALTWRGQWPPTQSTPELNLDSANSLIASATEASALVTIHIEYERPHVCFIGVPVRFAAKTFDLQEVTPAATWRRRPRRWWYSDISRVEVGGEYEEALSAVAGPLQRP